MRLSAVGGVSLQTPLAASDTFGHHRGQLQQQVCQTHHSSVSPTFTPPRLQTQFVLCTRKRRKQHRHRAQPLHTRCILVPTRACGWAASHSSLPPISTFRSMNARVREGSQPPLTHNTSRDESMHALTVNTGQHLAVARMDLVSREHAHFELLRSTIRCQLAATYPPSHPRSPPPSFARACTRSISRRKKQSHKPRRERERGGGETRVDRKVINATSMVLRRARHRPSSPQHTVAAHLHLGEGAAGPSESASLVAAWWCVHEVISKLSFLRGLFHFFQNLFFVVLDQSVSVFDCLVGFGHAWRCDDGGFDHRPQRVCSTTSW